MLTEQPIKQYAEQRPAVSAREIDQREEQREPGHYIDPGRVDDQTMAGLISTGAIGHFRRLRNIDH